MIVLQQIQVLPNCAQIEIIDDNDVLRFSKSYYDGSLQFKNAYDADKYYKMYSIFRVASLECDSLENHEIIYKIKVRG